MQIAYNDQDIEDFMADHQHGLAQEHPILVDKYLMGRELEVDAVCDGEDILIPGIMEHIERAGIHSGDSISVYPARSISEKHQGDHCGLHQAAGNGAACRGSDQHSVRHLR